MNKCFLLKVLAKILYKFVVCLVHIIRCG